MVAYHARICTSQVLEWNKKEVTVMLKEQRQIYYDRDLGLEAYHLSGIVQKFPNHFHDDYVIGFIEGGRRQLWCKGQTYALQAGDLIIFNPRDNHYCAPIGEEPLEYRALNIPPRRMEAAAREITGRAFLPHFSVNVLPASDITYSLKMCIRDSPLADRPYAPDQSGSALGR